MAWQLKLLPTAHKQLDNLSKTAREKVFSRLEWLEENVEVMIHHALVGMPDHLAGLCKLRSGDYRILYRKYPGRKLIEVFRVMHRSEVYRRF